MRGSLGLAILIVFAVGSPVRAQRSSVDATARLVVGEVLVLREVPKVGASGLHGVRVESGHKEVANAITLRVGANREWKVLAAPAVRAGVGRGIDWRVRMPQAGARTSVEGGYHDMPSRPVEVATGGPGRDIEIVIDYRWDEGEVPAVSPGSLMSYTVAPN